MLVGGRSRVVNILADDGMNSVRLRNVARRVGGEKPFLVTLNLVYGSLDFDFTNADVQQSTIDALQLVQILDISMNTLIFTHGGHVTRSRPGNTLSIHPDVNAEMLVEVVLSRELLATSVALERPLHRV